MQIVYPDSSWTIGKHALMNLHVVRRNGRTEIDPKSWRIPYQWQGCHYQDHDDQPFLLAINSGGGFVEGDSAHLYATMEEGTRALFTTTAASKFYKCPQGATSCEQIRIDVGAGALLEYHPDEAIMFAGSRVERRTRIDLDGSSRLFATDMIAAGRVHYGPGEAFKFEALESEFEVRIDGEPVLLDRLIVQGKEETEALRRLWGGLPHMATVIAVGSTLPKGIESKIEAQISDSGITSVGATRIDDAVICRILAAEAWICHDAVYQCWSLVRPYLADKPARPIRKC
ncbi:urease accessory protein UreD [Mesorhizobium sp. SP-1A]|uniref:urease accessory protein UreD n=1 Tax=Mesorhizobium sp. SP-1A TaxID=3077840 RepID=UPI0028F6F8D2|nr:urease accessory protein UreD [Mesorhizobium sp. SP-1A]